MRIAQNIVQLKTSLPQGVTLVAVSKFHPVEALWEAYNAGQRVFGESRAQELSAKHGHFTQQGMAKKYFLKIWRNMHYYNGNFSIFSK